MSLRVGAVFSMVTLAVESMLSPLESVAVAVQVMLSPTLLSEANTVYVLEVDTSFVPIVHEYDTVSAPSSSSLAVASQFRSVPV